jgi:hypothetical protein
MITTRLREMTVSRVGDSKDRGEFFLPHLGRPRPSLPDIERVPSAVASECALCLALSLHEGHLCAQQGSHQQ